MSILQVNLWTCEICGKTYATKEEVLPFDDPVVGYPSKEKWDFVGPDEKLACPECHGKKRGNHNVEPCVGANKSFKLFTDQMLKRIAQAFGISRKILYSTPNERHPSSNMLRQQQKSCKWALIDPEKEKKAMEVAKRQGIR